ncbi:MAG: hypothetical protein RMJ28_06855 [Nitrososphaerota archaeon]|nr:hypothetical protein [Candidatus Calditenuaceae archaeon]MDW8073932.1 hypothetical protein [Nitrososphaerota archaeon]
MLNTKTRLRVRGFWSASTSSVKEEIEPVRLAARRLELSLKEDLRRKKGLSRDERRRQRNGLRRAVQVHRVLFRRLKFRMRSL